MGFCGWFCRGLVGRRVDRFIFHHKGTKHTKSGDGSILTRCGQGAFLGVLCVFVGKIIRNCDQSPAMGWGTVRPAGKEFYPGPSGFRVALLLNFQTH